MTKQSLIEETDVIPYSLKLTQEWFASVVTQQLGENDTIQTYTFDGCLIAEEAARYITPSPHLRPHQRIQIYNQQYWWRLLNTLHSHFPLVTRLFGSHAFNERIGIPYLLKYPPHHWCLTLLGEHLPKWIEECYREPDQSLVYHAACLDWACMISFISPQFSPINLTELIQGNPENLLNYTFYLQPHLHLFTWEYDLLSFRESFLKHNMDYWIEHRFPDLAKGKTYRFVLYRNSKNNIAWREISQGELLLLECFKKGANITQACECVEKQEAPLYEEVASQLQQWLQEWTQAGWLTLTPPPESLD